MRQGCGRFKATANKLPVSMDKNRLSVSVFHGYNSIVMKRAFQELPTVNSERPIFFTWLISVFYCYLRKKIGVIEFIFYPLRYIRL